MLRKSILKLKYPGFSRFVAENLNSSCCAVHDLQPDVDPAHRGDALFLEIRYGLEQIRERHSLGGVLVDVIEHFIHDAEPLESKRTPLAASLSVDDVELLTENEMHHSGIVTGDECFDDTDQKQADEHPGDDDANVVNLIHGNFSLWAIYNLQNSSDYR